MSSCISILKLGTLLHICAIIIPDFGAVLSRNVILVFKVQFPAGAHGCVFQSIQTLGLVQALCCLHH
jgi:hypothetical protein